MTVRADHLAALDLRLQVLDRGAVPKEPRHVFAPELHVIEVQDAQVRFPAINAGVVAQVIDDETLSDCQPSLPSCIGLAPVVVAPRPEVRTEALSAPPLVAAAVTVERFQRKVLAARAALPCHEHMFALPQDGIGHGAGRGRRADLESVVPGGVV